MGNAAQHVPRVRQRQDPGDSAGKPEPFGVRKFYTVYVCPGGSDCEAAESQGKEATPVLASPG